MIISIDPLTYIISILQAELNFLGGANYQLDTNVFRIALKDWEDNEEGIYQPKTHTHNTTVLLGGIQYSRVLELLSPYTITFQETGTPYSVSLTGSNNNILEKTNLGTVQILSNNSAGLINVGEVQYGLFSGEVTIDVDNGSTGTTYPTGTPLQPVNNLADALAIALSRGFDTFFVRSNLTIDAGDFSNSFTFEGENQTRITITINTGANVTNCEFKNCTILGTLDGGNVLDDCILSTLSYANGVIRNCLLNTGTITLGGAVTAHFLNCFSGVPGTGTPTIDMGGSSQSLSMRNYNGGITLINKTGTDAVSIDLNSGQVALDSTVTNGTIVIRGIGKLTNNSTGTAIILADDLLNRANIAVSTWDELTASHITAGTTGKALTDAGAAGNPWDSPVAGSTAEGTFGELVGKKLLTVAKFLGLK
ncbi:MAG: hypothetical protein V4668_02585 [Patescibacteria group bacterium]